MERDPSDERGRVTLLVHMVWATYERERTLTDAHDAWLRAVLERTGNEVGAFLHACAIAGDHVHVVARIPSVLAVATLARRLKSVSALHWNRECVHAGARRLVWSRGYMATSVSPDELRALVRSLDDHRAFHAGGNAPEAWEAG